MIFAVIAFLTSSLPQWAQIIDTVVTIGQVCAFSGLNEWAISFNRIGMELFGCNARWLFALPLTLSLVKARRLSQAEDVLLRDLDLPSACLRMVKEAHLAEVYLGLNRLEEAIEHAQKAWGLRSQANEESEDGPQSQVGIMLSLSTACSAAANAADGLGRLEEAIQWDQRFNQAQQTGITPPAISYGVASRQLVWALMNNQLVDKAEKALRLLVTNSPPDVNDNKRQRKNIDVLIEVLEAKGTEEAQQEVQLLMAKAQQLDAEEEALIQVRVGKGLQRLIAFSLCLTLVPLLGHGLSS